MTQVFAEGQLSDTHARLVPGAVSPAARPGLPPIGRPRGPVDDQVLEEPLAPAPVGQALGPAMTAGKGVRAVRCVGCSRPTLPRQDDNAPLCVECCDLLAEPRQPAGFVAFWRRRR